MVPSWTSRPEVSKPKLRSGVGAPVSPQISYTLNKVLTAVARQHAIVDGLSHADMAGYELSPAERTALKDGDITGPYHLGANHRRVFQAR